MGRHRFMDTPVFSAALQVVLAVHLCSLRSSSSESRKNSPRTFGSFRLPRTEMQVVENDWAVSTDRLTRYVSWCRPFDTGRESRTVCGLWLVIPKRSQMHESCKNLGRHQSSRNADRGQRRREGGRRERKRTLCGSSSLLLTDRTHLSFSRC